jgi:hypothetical protein
MTTSALLRHAPRTRVLLDGLSAWMARKGSAVVEELREILSVAPGTARQHTNTTSARSGKPTPAPTVPG